MRADAQCSADARDGVATAAGESVLVVEAVLLSRARRCPLCASANVC